MVEDSQSSAKLRERKIVLVMSLKYTPVTQSILCLIFLSSVLTVQRLHYTRQQS